MEVNISLEVETFSKDEKILCYHGPQIFEAKVLKCGNTAENREKYLVHYSGWKKRWDEWVPRSRMLKYNEDNLLLQQELAKEAEKSNKKPVNMKSPKTKRRKVSSAKETSPGSSFAAPTNDQLEETMDSATSSLLDSTASTSAKDKADKRKSAATTKATGSKDCLPSPDGKIQIPEELKKILVDDWYLVTNQNHLCQLPANLPVQAIVNKYVEYKQRDKSAGALSESTVQSFADGIVEYFNILLGSQLLYKFERPQYSEMIRMHACVPMAQIYGISHLLRLFVKLGAMLVFSKLDDDSFSAQISYMHDFLSFMLQHKTSLKKSQPYIESTADYIRKAQ